MAMVMGKWLLACFCFISSTHAIQDLWYDSYIPGTYNPLKSPVYGGSVEIGVVVWVLTFYDFNMDTAQISADIYLGQHWREPRLTSDKTRVTSQLILPEGEKFIWIPDTFIPEAVSVYKSQGPNSLLRIEPDGGIFYSQKLQVRIPCEVSYGKFPFDEVCCKMAFESFAMNSSRLHYSWREVEDNFTKMEDINPDLKVVKTDQTFQEIHMGTDEFSRLELIFLLVRASNYYVYNIILPLGGFVILSYLTFFISAKAPTPRLLLSSILLLAALYVTMEMKHHLPHTPYWTAVDAWSTACFMFMGTAMVATILVICINNPDFDEKPNRIRSFLQKVAEKSDYILCMAYPAVFTLFAAIYCAVYLG